MKKIKSFIERIAGLHQTAGTPVNLVYGGGPRIQSTVEPDETLGFNEFWERVYKLNKHKTP